MAIRIVSRHMHENVGNSETFGFCFLFVLKKQVNVGKKSENSINL